MNGEPLARQKRRGSATPFILQQDFVLARSRRHSCVTVETGK